MAESTIISASWVPTCYYLQQLFPTLAMWGSFYQLTTFVMFLLQTLVCTGDKLEIVS